MSYNYVNETWFVNQLIFHCIQEKERLIQDKVESAHLPSIFKDKSKKMKKEKQVVDAAPLRKQQKKPFDSSDKGYFFYGVEGHDKKHYTNYDTWHAKKDICFNLVCFEINLTSILRHMWWIDFDVTSYIIVSMQGC